MSPPSLREVYADGLVMWYDLCAGCSAAFKAWQCAPNPGAWANPKVQEYPQLLAFLAACRATGPDPQQWRDTISHQLLLIRKICTTWHASRRLWEHLACLGYGYPDGFPPASCPRGVLGCSGTSCTWACPECGCRNCHEVFCYQCGAGDPGSENAGFPSPVT